jgi:hypothetical protein
MLGESYWRIGQKGHARGLTLDMALFGRLG